MVGTLASVALVFGAASVAYAQTGNGIQCGPGKPCPQNSPCCSRRSTEPDKDMDSTDTRVQNTVNAALVHTAWEDAILYIRTLSIPAYPHLSATVRTTISSHLMT